MRSLRVSDLLQKLLRESYSGENVQVRGDSSVAVLAHEATLTQMLFNLISNGLKFKKPDTQPRVEIAITRREEGMLRIAVADNGIGIMPQHLGKLFRVFERLHGVEEYPGTGIGLAIVKRGSERMGGRCGVESKEGEGSTFWVELPEAKTK